MGNKVTQTHSGSGNNVAGDMNITNNYNNSQDLTQAAAEIQSLLEQLSKGRNVSSMSGKMQVATEAVQTVEENKPLMKKLLSAGKAGAVATLESVLDHPAASFVIAAVEDWQQN